MNEGNGYSGVHVVLAFLAGLAGISGIAFGASGYMLIPLNWIERVCLIVGGILLCAPILTTNLIGLGLIIIPVIMQLRRRAMKPVPADSVT